MHCRGGGGGGGGERERRGTRGERERIWYGQKLLPHSCFECLVRPEIAFLPVLFCAMLLSDPTFQMSLFMQRDGEKKEGDEEEESSVKRRGRKRGRRRKKKKRIKRRR